MSYHHTHCPVCDKVLRVKYGMVEKCGCTPPAPRGPSVQAQTMHQMVDAALTEQIRRLGQGIDRRDERIQTLEARVRTLEAQLADAANAARINADAKQVLDSQEPCNARAQEYFMGVEDRPFRLLGRPYLEVALDEIVHLNTALCSAHREAARLEAPTDKVLADKVLADKVAEAVHKAVLHTFTEYRKG